MDDDFTDPIERELAAAERRPSQSGSPPPAKADPEQRRIEREIERHRALERETGRWSWHRLECPFEAIERLPVAGLFEWERRDARRAAAHIRIALSGRADGEAIYAELTSIIDAIPSEEAAGEASCAALGRRVERVARGEATAEDWVHLAAEGVAVTPLGGEALSGKSTQRRRAGPPAPPPGSSPP